MGGEGTTGSLNGDMSRRALMDSEAMAWQPSPSGSVFRKRLHLVGAPESGQVTSIVRYEPDSSFPAHDHPEGEEILVLEGVFSDEHGDWPAGTYLLNPEGFRHAPFSKEGCVIFVKLRQFAGEGREHVATPVDDLPWKPGDTPGIETKVLYEHPSFQDTTHLERWAPGTAPGEQRTDDGFEILVLEGSLQDEWGRYGPGTWLRMPPGSSHIPYSQNGSTLYRKSGAIAALREAPAR